MDIKNQTIYNILYLGTPKGLGLGLRQLQRGESTINLCSTCGHKNNVTCSSSALAKENCENLTDGAGILVRTPGLIVKRAG